jgi:hypothetical protein
MDNQRVKKKLPLSVLLILLAICTFLASWGRLFPGDLVEKAYSRTVFPTISHISGLVADSLPFSWLDVWIVVAVALLFYGIRKRKWLFLGGVFSIFYLWFFWSWGLNYHRPSLTSRLQVRLRDLSDSDLSLFTETAAREINRLWLVVSQAPPLDRKSIGHLASRRIERVVLKIDGTNWRAAKRVKRSVLLEPWYKIAGVDGMFNPFGHEPLVIAGPYPYELPFLMSHELAHVRGIANEGEANLAALLATVASDDPRFQYSGWLYVWGYLPRSPGIPLDPGPLADLRAIAARLKANQIELASNVQSAILDAHLKANAVPGGIRSYSEFVVGAIATQPRWKDFQ